MITRRAGALTIVHPGMLTTIQDLGRPGRAHLGVSPSGAADRAALSLANRLVGNSERCPGLECTFGGLVFTLDADRHVSVTGAHVAVFADGQPITEPQQFFATAGTRIALGQPPYGLRTYVAVAGGLDAPRTLGSAATDTLSGLGGSPLRPNTELALATPTEPVPDIPLELAVTRGPTGVERVRFWWGPRIEGIPQEVRSAFIHAAWHVSSDTSRVGARLIGPPLSLGAAHQFSEGMVTGTIQIPASGQPIVFLADHPVTGGYPVIGVVTEDDIGIVAQGRPGTRLLFAPLG